MNASSLEVVVGLDELLDESLSPFRVRQHCLEARSYLSSRLLVQQNQI